MSLMSGNDESSCRDFGGSSQQNNWIVDSVPMCHITPQVSDFIPGSLEDTDEYIEVADGHYIMAKQKGKVQITICNDNGDTFNATLHNVIFAPDIFDGFSMITLINLGHICLFH